MISLNPIWQIVYFTSSIFLTGKKNLSMFAGTKRSDKFLVMVKPIKSQ
jgi:hypothetical protein